MVLVDEYDKPLLEALENNELEEHNKAVFKGFFGTLKSYDEYLQFVFITGVTKFSKVSIFSDLNQLNDISLFEEYSGICGMTEAEICDNFQPELQSVAARHQISEEKFLQELGKMYDGYHFFPGSPGIYNPFSVLNALTKGNFRIFGSLLTLLGQHTHCEVHSSRGRADCVLETDKFVYIFEFKVDKSGGVFFVSQRSPGAD